MAAGKAEPPPPVKLSGAKKDSRAADSCEPQALRAAATKAEPLTAEVAEKIGDSELAGGRGVSCVKPVLAGATGRSERDAMLAAQKRKAPGTVEASRRAATGLKDPSTTEVVDIPEWCLEHADGQWRGYRTEQCRIGDVLVVYYVYHNGVWQQVGTALALEYSFAYTSDLIDRYAFQLTVRKYWGRGAGNFEGWFSVVAGAYCTNDCKESNGGTGLRPGRFDRGVVNDAESYWESTRSSEPGDIGYSYPSWEWHVDGLGFVPTQARTTTTPLIRCDNAFSTDGNESGDPETFAARQPTVGAGCVFPRATPVMTYSKTGSYPTLAAHIEAAQNSGLPGKYPDGPTLTRLQDPVKKRANGRTACPPSWVRPTGKSCDEYPFRSTKQGASTQEPQGTARTFAPPDLAWCEMDSAWGVPTGVTGPTGWSSCMIPKDDNSQGGAQLSPFYHGNRILDGDPFLVRITS
ncbi:hypothetical protein E1293_24950 [Actinomadura darangshiensis]|uniref:Uncharacterized protein n=1 Tax=Actinomadura darangshiensis TaxID=705336 RepID=A0A4R5B0G3_9ACTN|nr:hypothetical protein [Actinomadura darangshiensis]TDD78029.1 hypothetical protein E1293_24950 [Actinomadura darangshiensis]